MPRKRANWIARKSGVEVERVLLWAAAQGLPYRQPTDQFSEQATEKALKHFRGDRKASPPLAAGPGPTHRSGRTSPSSKQPDWLPGTEIVDDLGGDWSAQALASVSNMDPMSGRRPAIPAQHTRNKSRDRTVTAQATSHRPQPVSSPTARVGKTARDRVKRAKRAIDVLLESRGLETVPRPLLQAALPPELGKLLANENVSKSDQRRLTAALDQAIVPVCSNEDCRESLMAEHPDSTLVEVADSSCRGCRGSDNRRAGRRAGKLLEAAGIRSLLLVGSNQEHQRLLEDATTGIRITWVRGDGKAPSSQAARGRVRSVGLVVLEGGGRLSQPIRQAFKDASRKQKVPCLESPKPGLATLVDTLERLSRK